ncbi:outer membrane beta-barrel protein [Cysteiniphilum litorale]|uniref:outer membrane beta-barrel protein n=1 Tax=Cysteiniphilum litorale TaxID=2056700 RepID=UPI003F882679
MTKMNKIIGLSAIALLSISAANAGAQSGLVVGGNVGYSFAQNGFANHKGGVAFGGLVGYDYALNQSVSVGAEMDLQYANQVSKTAGNKINVWNVPLFLVGKYYFGSNKQFNVFGKAGYAWNRVGANDNYSKIFRPVVAVGAGYQLSRTMNVFAQYQYNWLPQGGHSMGQATASVGLTYTIPMGPSNYFSNEENNAIGQEQPVMHNQPAAAEAPTAIGNATYTVKKGDTLYDIAVAHGLSKTKGANCIAKENNITNPSKIRVGQKLVIPAVHSC